MIATLEIKLPKHTWNIIINSKSCFVIIKTEINQILVSQLCIHLFNHITLYFNLNFLYYNLIIYIYIF